jgi:ABC-type nitrate/sulfonate/bicarbonate transport system substrate-binding protein
MSRVPVFSGRRVVRRLALGVDGNPRCNEHSAGSGGQTDERRTEAGIHSTFNVPKSDRKSPCRPPAMSGPRAVSASDVTPGTGPVEGANGGVVRIGFVPLIDAAPLVAAYELGLFERHGVRVTLERQIGWANLRDKLTYGQLDAGHALLGMPLTSVLSADCRVGEPLVSVMELGTGGNAITLSKALADRGVRSAATLARWLAEAAGRSPPGGGDARKPIVAHVFGCSMHHYLLREWLAAAGVDPDFDVRLVVIPPEQMPGHLQTGHLDGYCVGEPYNTAAEWDKTGVVVTPTTDILPDHPEKVLAVTRRWAAAHGPAVVALVKALLEACAWCDDATNHPALAGWLAKEQYIGLPADLLAASLAIDRSVGVAARHASPRPMDWRMRSFRPAATFPSATHAAWMAEQMIRWGHAPSDTDVVATARACTDARFYRQAAAELGIPFPDDDLVPMPLRHGSCYDAKRSPYRGQPPRLPAPETADNLIDATAANES